MTRQPSPRDKLKVTEAAAELGVDRQKVYKWIGEGQLEHYRYPGTGEGDGTIRIERAEITRFLAACKRPAHGRTA